jgi:hypothetical protein
MRSKLSSAKFAHKGFGLKERAHINCDGQGIWCRILRIDCSLLIRAFSHHETTDLELLIVLDWGIKEILVQLL